MDNIRSLGEFRTLITRSVLIYLLCILIWRSYSVILPFQLLDAPLTRVDYDLSLWIYKIGLHKLVVSNSIASVVFCVFLFFLNIVCIKFPANRALIILFTIFFLIFSISFNVALTHASHVLGGAMIICFAFWPKKDNNFEVLWDALRYYVCWIYFSAFLWKVVNGSMFQHDFGVITMKKNLAEYLYHNPDTIKANLYYYFIAHPWLPNIGDKIVYILEAIFICGFFTKKHDRLLILLLVGIHGITYIFTDRLFIELCILVIPLISVKGWRNLQRFLTKSRGKQPSNYSVEVG